MSPGFGPPLELESTAMLNNDVGELKSVVFA